MKLLQSLKRGFTLLEVLVALFIVAIALGTSIRAIGSLSKNNQKIELNTFATWSAENILTEMKLMRVWPEIGTKNIRCDQGKYKLICEIKTIQTPNQFFKRVEVSVTEVRNPKNSIIILTQLITNEF